MPTAKGTLSLTVLCSFSQSIYDQEADAMLIVHLLGALKRGLRTYFICNADTEFFVILLGKFTHLLAASFYANI